MTEATCGAGISSTVLTAVRTAAVIAAMEGYFEDGDGWEKNALVKVLSGRTQPQVRDAQQGPLSDLTGAPASGFESVCAKYDAASRIAHRDVPTTVLSVGDYDPSGLSILDAAAEDVAAFVAELGGTPPTVKRLAVTEEQITRYALETAPQKGTDRRGDHMHATVQAEALSPTQLTDLVRAGVEEAVDLRALERVRARSERERQQLVRKAERLR
ncbi:hypothetical protein [Streptomyces olivaceoviridis]|uniref:hypothetical protein n=1 Tax=Streptomyces olivaceoviridis TaxID=1921 RepID=UPI0037B18749